MNFHDPTAKPGWLGDLPRGFVYSDGVSPGLACDSTAPAYVRGILLPTPSFDALDVDQRLVLRNPNVYPRWRLFGGPFSLKYVAEQWDSYLHFWGFDKNLTWVSHGVACIVPSYILAWPADQSLRWDWVYEKTQPKIASRKYDQNKGQYVVTVV